MRTILRPCHLAGRDKSKERGWHPHQAFCGQIHTALSPHRAKAAQELLSATKLDKPEPLGWGIPLVASSHLHSPLPELRDHCRSTTKGQHPGVLKSWQGFYCWELYSRSSFSFDKSIAVSYRCFRAGSLRKSTTCHTPKSDVSSIKVKNRFPTPLFERQLSVNAHCKFIFLWDPHPHPFPPPCRKKKKKKSQRVMMVWAVIALSEDNSSSSELRFAEKCLQTDGWIAHKKMGQLSPSFTIPGLTSLVGLNLHSLADFTGA